MHLDNDPYQRWTQWTAAFEQAVARDDWHALGNHLTDDVIYRVMGAPFDCELRGRDAVVAGLAKSVRGFDHRFARRTWTPIGIRIFDSGYVTCRIHAGYHLDEATALHFEATGHWGFRGDRIALMLDFYDLGQRDVQQALATLATLGEAFDPRYV